MAVNQLVADFATLFQGRLDAHGVGRGGVVRINAVGDPADLWRNAWAPLYAEHLRGEGTGLGVFPLLDDGTCHWAAIDLDEPDFEGARFMQTMLPGVTWLERSRSGNAHVLAFFREPIAAWIPRGLMRIATEAAGKRGVEIFPKQDRLLPGMLGNYLNLCYHGNERPILVYDEGYGYYEAHREAFVAEALAKRNDPAEWEAYARRMGVESPEERELAGDRAEWGQQPNLHICAESILERSWEDPLVFDPPRAGEMVLFHVAKQLLNWRELDEETAWTLLSELNDRCVPPVHPRELRRLFDNALRVQYTSTGCDDPVFEPYAHPDCPIAKAARAADVKELF